MPDPSLRLHCLGGDPPPAGLEADLRQLLSLPPSAREAFWDLLQPNLAATIDERTEAAVARFCEEHGVAPSALVAVARASRQVVRRAAELDVSLEQFADDMTALFGGDTDGAHVLVGCYAKAHPLLRAERVLGTLHEFGPVLRDVHARLDLIPASRHSERLAVPVVMMSFRYREGTRDETMNVQVPADVLTKLKLTCDALVGS